MAHCRGRSGPLDDVLRAARRLGLDAAHSDLRSIEAHEARLAGEFRVARAAAELAVAEEIAGLRDSLAGEDPCDAAERGQVESKTEAAVAAIEDDIRRLEAQRGVIRTVVNWFRLRSRRSAVRRWKWWRHERLREIDGRFDERKRRLVRLLAAPAAEIDGRVRPQLQTLDGFRSLLASPEMIGARAEVQVAEELGRLSDSFEVLHHLHLRASHFVRHNRKPVVSAEVDHLVVGPTGIYLVETKCWGARFVADGAFFDPFEQTDRAGLLCHVLLKEARLPAKVRQIVTPFASLPAPPQGSYTRVVPPNRLRRWIENGNATLGPDDVRVVAQFLWDNFGGGARTAA
jgi:hypothetical protein